MLFPTIAFGIFFPIVFVGAWLTRPRPVRWKLFLLAASYVFYGWWEPRYCVLLAGSTVVNHAVARLLAACARTGARRAVLTFGIVANLGVLAYFKYYGFFLTSARAALGRLGVDVAPPLLEIVLPIGISFFTFQAITYLVDTWRGSVRPVSLLDFAVYLAFFPHLVAGPIVRASEFLPQLRGRGDPRSIESARAFRLITMGLFKKVVVSSYLATAIVDPVFGAPGHHTNVEVLFAVYAYAIQIYADFSGYTDIAIGCALLLGITFPPNFDSPYTAHSLQDFWHRWHMTLSRFLRDYLYVPLGGNRGGHVYRNLILVMVIGGLWHGAAWTFVVWGMIHGGVLAFERWVPERRRALGFAEPRDTPGHRLVRWLITFHVVCLAWVFFRSPDFGVAGEMLGRLLTGWGVGTLVTPMLVTTIGLMLLAQFVPSTFVDDVQARVSYLPLAVQGVLLAGAFCVIDALGPVGVAPFIYFQF